jgi:hypothetical protein
VAAAGFTGPLDRRQSNRPQTAQSSGPVEVRAQAPLHSEGTLRQVHLADACGFAKAPASAGDPIESIIGEFLPVARDEQSEMVRPCLRRRSPTRSWRSMKGIPPPARGRHHVQNELRPLTYGPLATMARALYAHRQWFHHRPFTTLTDRRRPKLRCSTVPARDREALTPSPGPGCRSMCGEWSSRTPTRCDRTRHPPIALFRFTVNPLRSTALGAARPPTSERPHSRGRAMPPCAKLADGFLLAQIDEHCEVDWFS